MAESVFVTRTEGIGCEGVRDQYADGKAAKLWEIFIGCSQNRTRHYNTFLVDLLKTKGCRRILDVACGTGVDSIMLLEEGFDVMSIDASDKMLKYALKKRWDRRKEKAFDNWIIEEANWLTLADDIEGHLNGGFDAVICLGNSFAHLMEISGDQSGQKKALRNFEYCLKPGGILVIDHRNFDAILDGTTTPLESIYYRKIDNLTTSVLTTAGKPVMVTLDYKIDPESLQQGKKGLDDVKESVEFRLSYYPHRLKNFTELLFEAFPRDSTHMVLRDFKQSEQVENPSFFIHVIEKPTI